MEVTDNGQAVSGCYMGVLSTYGMWKDTTSICAAFAKGILFLVDSPYNLIRYEYKQHCNNIERNMNFDSIYRVKGEIIFTKEYVSNPRDKQNAFALYFQ